MEEIEKNVPVPKGEKPEAEALTAALTAMMILLKKPSILFLNSDRHQLHHSRESLSSATQEQQE